MATCSSLSSLFERPLPENPTFLESLSWAQIMAKKPIDTARSTEIFSELHFLERPPPSSGDRNCTSNGGKAPSESLFGLPESHRNRCETSSILLKNSDSLQLCTEGLGSESSDDVDDLGMDEGVADGNRRSTACEPCDYEDDINDGGYPSMRPPARMAGRFPPPIPWLVRSGKPCSCFKSYRVDGRFILREVRIPTQEFLHASRQDGRLKLHFVQPEDEDQEHEEYEEEGGKVEVMIRDNTC